MNYKVFSSYLIPPRKCRKQLQKWYAPSKITVNSIIKINETRSSVADARRSGRSKTSTNNKKVAEIQVLSEKSPGKSLKRVSVASNVCLRTALTLAK